LASLRTAFPDQFTLQLAFRKQCYSYYNKVLQIRKQHTLSTNTQKNYILSGIPTPTISPKIPQPQVPEYCLQPGITPLPPEQRLQPLNIAQTALIYLKTQRNALSPYAMTSSNPIIMAEALAGQAATRQLAQEAARQARHNAQG
jgi:hypothetical protein